MEIIREGTKNRVTCDFCGAVLGYKTTDIKKEIIHLSQRETKEQKYLHCPQCANKIILERETDD